MKINKKRIFVTVGVVAALVGVSVAAGVVVRNVNAQVITVVPVESLVQDMDGMFFDSDEDSLTGQVANHTTQVVRLAEDAIVSEVYVKAGDHVHTGDRLMSYDTTLKEMELEIERLVKQQNEQKLEKARKRLYSLENGGPIEEDDDTSKMQPGSSAEDSDDDSDDSDDSRENVPRQGGIITSVGVFRPVSVRTEDDPGVTPEPTGMETPGPTETGTPSEPTGTPEPEIPGPYKYLDYDSEPFAGEGTKKSPYLFWGDVNACGFTKKLKEKFLDSIRDESFLNKMAGFDADGEEQLTEDPFFYRIVFYSCNDMTGKPLCMTDVIGGGFDGEPEPTETPEGGDDDVDIDSDEFGDLADFDDSDFDFDSDSDFGYDSDSDAPDDSGGSKLSRETAIANQRKNIESLQLEIRENSLSISKLEKEVANQTVRAAMDGVVSVAGEPGTAAGSDKAFLKVKSDEGLFIRSAVSEIQLSQIDLGQTVEVTAYESGTTCKAEIRDISQFPEDDGGDYYMMGNPNMSYYAFTAVVDEDADLINNETVAIKLADTEETDDALNIEVAFVREENGVPFVYKEENGKLKRQPVDAMKNPDGYTVAIRSGLSIKDKIAFPYGKGVKNGARTKEGTLDDVYGYY